MNSSKEPLKAWQPQTMEDRDAIRRELQEILASPHFCNSKRYPALLRHVVEAALAGRSDTLKERTLGIEVFDRPATYDTNTDTVVRYTAGEVRKRLLLYYSDRSHDAGIHISLPPGSYVPEFMHGHDEPVKLADESDSARAYHTDADVRLVAGGESPDGAASLPVASNPASNSAHEGALETGAKPARHKVFSKRLLWLAPVVVLAVAALAIFGWQHKAAAPRTALEDFWQPILQGQGTVLICTGGADVAAKDPMGVKSADKNTEYPLVSIQAASSISLLSALIERGGSTAQLRFAASTPLTELRNSPLVLLTGYNNPWTMRFVEPLRFHFAPEPNYAIVDQTQPQVRWERDPAIHYSSADDYALVARFWNKTTDSWVVVLAGVGRNGMEAAAQFAASPHYMQLLREQIGSDFANRNVEVVLKVGVVDGKTGAPSILATHVW